MGRYRTPLRYPGGKQRIAPFIHELLTVNSLVGGHYVEQYAGGAEVAMELLLDGIVEHVHLNDISPHLYSFWRSAISRTDELCERIASASLTVEEWQRRRAVLQRPGGHDELDIAFSTLYLNRCNRSGVLSGGLIGSIAQNGEWNMDARFPRSHLIRRIGAIASRRDAITIHNDDAEVFIRKYIRTLPENTLVYCDPPYFNLRSRLYLSRYTKDDHARIAQLIQNELKHRWVVLYDNATGVREFFRDRRSFSYHLQYNAAQVYQGNEIFVFSDDLIIP